MRHHVVRPASTARFEAPSQAWASGAAGYRRWRAVGEDDGAAHTGFVLGELDPGGHVPAHVHSFEESFHVVAGTALVDTPEGTVQVTAGDYGLFPVGVPHAWRNAGDATVRWAEMQSPTPRGDLGEDTVGADDLPRTEPRPVDVRDPSTRRYGSITPDHMDVAKQSQELLAASASMRTALLVYSGITLKMMVDTDLDAQLANMFMVSYEPDGVAGPHDHPLEETYWILEGTTEATFDGQTYLLGPGDVAWTGVGCIHSFRNAGGGRLRWLETQAPLPPSRHAYRFARDWDYLRRTVDA